MLGFLFSIYCEGMLMKENKKEWILPDLKSAQKRTKNDIPIERLIFDLPEVVRDMGKARKYYLRTYGCQANERDGETIAGILQAMGYTMTTSAEDADFILLNTCAVRKNAEDKVFGEIGNFKHLKATNPDLILGVCGCMPQEEEVVNTILKTYPHVDLIFGTHNIHRLPQLLHQVSMSKERTIEVFSKEGEVIENLPVARFGTHKAWVNIMYGCDKFCTYCIVPYTRGKERSRLIEDILLEIEDLKSRGFKEVTLLGQNVNAYGKDLKQPVNFAMLLKSVAKTEISRIRFTTSHPWDFSDEMIDVIASYKNVMPFIHLPVQSGNSDMLKIMGRRYSIDEYKTLFGKLKERIADCAFSTDIIVGFPNETDEQFQQTLDIVDFCQFDNAFTFIYSPREGTPAAAMMDNVPKDVKKKRLAELNAKVAKYALKNNQAYIGRTVEVLVDGPSKKNSEIYSGYTMTQKLVNFKAEGVLSGDLVNVRITDCKTWFLIGEQA
jgi:tRNA-2-methylthio-N6-dimethylallyladenosine synthase